MAVRKNTKALSQKSFAEAIQRFLGAGIESEQVDPDQYNMACYILLESPHYKILMHQWRDERENYLGKARAAKEPEERTYCFACAEVYKDIISDTLYAAKEYVESAVEQKKQIVS